MDAISDRICIHSDGKLQPEISAKNLMACCVGCGNGCKGGNTVNGWRWYNKTGIATGGAYQSNIVSRVLNWESS